MDIPSKHDHLRMLTAIVEHNRRSSAEKLAPYKYELEIIGSSLSTLYQVGTCHRKCFGGPHVLERLSGRAYNLASSSYILICSGFYDESLNLVRSLGEIANLVSMSVVDKKALQGWLSADKKTRINKYGPASIRKILAKHADYTAYASDAWYSKFCEDYTHVHPDTMPNFDVESGRSHVGGFVQVENMAEAISELSVVTCHIAMIASKFADLDDMFDELAEMVDSL